MAHLRRCNVPSGAGNGSHIAPLPRAERVPEPGHGIKDHYDRNKGGKKYNQAEQHAGKTGIPQ